jgi:hypothetical protein
VCDDARATVTVPSFALVANPDSGRVGYGAGGTPVANVLANDTIGGLRATLAAVNLALVSTSHSGVTLDLSDGSVDVAPGTTHGTQTLVYSICERANPVNCKQATVTINPNLIDAVDDSYRLSSKIAGSTPSVFSNDSFNGVRPTASVVRATILGALPYGVEFNASTGVLSTRGKVTSGTYFIQYQICELGNLANCDSARVTLDLTGKNN